MNKNPATVADAERKPFAYFVQPSSFGPFIECEPSQVGCFPAYRAAPVGADVAASVLLKLCNQLDTMKLRLRAIPDEGQRESYYVADDVNCYVEEARAHWWWASRDGGAPAETVKAVATVIKKGADRKWMSERLGTLPDGIYSLYLAAPAVAPDVAKDAARLAIAEACEGVEILTDFMRSVEKHGNYSVEATLTFIGQAKQCFAAMGALPPAGGTSP